MEPDYSLPTKVLTMAVLADCRRLGDLYDTSDEVLRVSLHQQHRAGNSKRYGDTFHHSMSQRTS